MQRTELEVAIVTRATAAARESATGAHGEEGEGNPKCRDCGGCINKD